MGTSLKKKRLLVYKRNIFLEKYIIVLEIADYEYFKDIKLKLFGLLGQTFL